MDRHGKWTPVEPGTVIPAGQRYRVEYGTSTATVDTVECVSKVNETAGPTMLEHSRDQWFVDSSWEPSHPCSAPLNIKGEGFNCDRGWGHVRPHGNVEAGAIWDDEQPPESMEPDTPCDVIREDSIDDFIQLTPEQVARIEEHQ